MLLFFVLSEKRRVSKKDESWHGLCMLQSHACQSESNFAEMSSHLL